MASEFDFNVGGPAGRGEWLHAVLSTLLGPVQRVEVIDSPQRQHQHVWADGQHVGAIICERFHFDEDTVRVIRFLQQEKARTSTGVPAKDDVGDDPLANRFDGV